MDNPGRLCDRFLEQCPACSWIVRADYFVERVYGDSVPVFGIAAAELGGRRLDDSLPPEAAGLWRSRVDRATGGETVLLRERRGEATRHISLFPMREAGTVLAGGFAFDITPWSTAERELRHTVLGALRAQEFERSMMSRFLHDTVGQNLSAAGLQLDLIRMDLEAQPEVGVRIAEIQQNLEGMMQQLRDYSYELNPNLVERAGLHAALDRLAGRMRGRFQGTLRLILDPSQKVPSRFGTALYQIAQEAVENAVQHSGCSLIEIAIKSTKGGPILEVRDNGRGFDPAGALEGRRGLGLLTMEHFAAQAGLDVSIASTRENGTVVRAAPPEAAKP
jgi:signal transduction histidine kinase